MFVYCCFFCLPHCLSFKLYILLSKMQSNIPFTHAKQFTKNRPFLYNRVLGTSTAAFFLPIIFFMQLLPRMIVKLYFICIDSVDLRGARGKRKIEND